MQPAAILQIYVRAQTGQATAALQKTQGQLTATQAAGNKASAVLGRMGQVAKVGAVGMAGAAALGVKAYAGFEREMTKSVAIMDDISGPMRKRMEAAARSVGKTTQFSAEQGAEAYFFLASAGMDAQQSLKAMPRVAKFAQAGQFDLATATDLATDAQSALGLKAKDAAKNLKNLNRVQDVLVRANTLSNAKVEEFSKSLTNKAATAAKVLGKDIEETTAVLAAFADQGVKGELGGNALNIVWRDLGTAALKNEAAFKKQGVAVYNGQEEMRNTAKIVGDLEKALGGMSDKQKKATLARMGFQDRSQAFILALLGSSKAISTYEQKLNKAAGFTDKVANKQLKGFTGAWIKVKSQVSDVVLEIGERLAPTLQELGEILGDRKLTSTEKFEKAFELLVEFGERALAKAVDAAEQVGPKMVSALGEGFAKSWTQMNPLVKLFTAGALIRVVGGKGALTAAGAGIGRFIGLGVTAGTASTVGAGAGGAAAGGAAAGGLAGVFGGLGKVRWARVAGVALGVSIANGVIEGFGHQGGGIREKLAAFGSGVTLGLLPAPRQIDERMATIVERIQNWKGKALALSDPSRPDQSLIREKDLDDFTKRQQRMLRGMADLRNQANVLFGPGARMIDRAWASPQKALRDLNALDGGMQKMKAGVFTSMEDIKKVSKRNMRIVGRTLGEGTRDGRVAAAANLKATAQAYSLHLGKKGPAAVARGQARIVRMIERANIIGATEKQARGFGRTWAAGMTHGHVLTKKGMDNLTGTMISEMKMMSAPMRQAAYGAWHSQVKEAQRSGRISKAEAQDMRSKVLAAFQGIEAGSKRKSKNTSSAVIRTWERLTNTSMRGMEIFGQNADSLLSSFDLGPLNYNLKKFKPFGSLQKNQKGGVIVPGQGDGDKVPAMLEPGEVVINKKAVAAMGGARKANAINREVPRFQVGGVVQKLQAGGMVRVPGDPPGPFPDTVNKSVAGIAADFVRRFKLNISAAFNPGGSHKSPGHNVTGTAIDIIPGPGGSWDLVGKAVAAAVARGMTTYYDGSHGSTALSNHGPGNHAHIELGSSGAVAPLLEKLPHLAFEGSEGPLRDLGQAALDKVRRAGDRFLAKKSMVTGAGDPFTSFGGAGGDFGKGDLMSLWTRKGGSPGAANLAAAIALAESGGNSRASNVNTDGSIDRGLWQINSVHGALSTFDPEGNAQAAKAISGNGSDWSPWVAYQKGMHNQFLQAGGIVQKLQPGGVAGKGPKVGRGREQKRGGDDRRPATFGQRLDERLRNVANAKGKRKQRKALGTFKAVEGLGLDKQQKALRELSEKAQKFSDYASNAATLTTQDAEGNDVPGLFQGKDEGHWLNQQLDALMELRNKLIGVETKVSAQQKRAAKLMAVAERRLKRVQAQIAKASARRRNLQRRIRGLSGRGGKIPTAEKQLEKLREKPRRNRSAIKAKRAKIGRLRERERSLKRTDRAVERNQAKRVQMRDALTGDRGVITKLKDKQKGLNTLRGNVLGDGDGNWKGLAMVQGADGPDKPMSKLPALGTLGGEILSAQSALRSFGRKPDVSAPPPSDSGDSERAGLLERLLRAANQRTAVADKQFAVLRDFPMTLARGGAVPGSGTGDKVRALLEPGEVVINRKAVAAMGGAQKVNEVNQEIPRFQTGGIVQQVGGPTASIASAAGSDVRVLIQDQRTRVFVDDKEVRAIVKDETRKDSRTAIASGPGRGGGLIG